jgi:FtsX-like permease family
VAVQTKGVPPGRPLWRKAPTRLVRRPALFLALAAAALLVTVIAAAYPLFLAGTESRLLAAAITNPTFSRYGVGISYRATGVPLSASGLTQQRADDFDDIAKGSDALGPVVASAAGQSVEISGPKGTSGSALNGRMLAGDDALDHVHILSGHAGDGVFLPDFIAKSLHAVPGDHIQLQLAGHVVTVPVDGVYQALYAGATDGYWLGWYDAIHRICLDCPLPPQFLITTPSELASVMNRLEATLTDQLWVAPVRVAPPLTLNEAKNLGVYADGVERQMSSGSLASTFSCCGQYFLDEAEGMSTTTFHSAAGEVVDQVAQRTAGVQGPVRLVLFAGLAIALVVIAVAGGFSFASRPVETGMLTVRGWSPWRVGVKGTLESLIPIVVGAIVGVVLAVALVSLVGPSAPVGGEALRAALVNAGAAILTSVVIVGVVMAVGFSSAGEHRGWLARVFLWFPWEIPALIAAIAVGRRLYAGGGVITTDGIQRPSASVLLFPLAVGLAAAIVTARILAALLLRRARSRRGDGVSASWLAVRRLTTSLRISVVFFVAAVLAVSVFVGAQAVVASLRATVDAKARLFVGSDVELQGASGKIPPAHFPLPTTLVQRSLSAGFFDGDDTQEFDLVIIDPSTFASAAYWNPALSSTSIEDLVRALQTSGGDAAPILVANAAGTDPASITVGRSSTPVTVVGRALSFPGASSTNPIVVMTRDEVERSLHQEPESVSSTQSTTELWIRGPTATALADLGPAGIQADRVVTADEVKDIPLVLATVNTFVVLNILGVVALCLAVVLGVVYLQVRQRSRSLASTLSTRMGSDDAMARRSLTLELGAPLLVALVVGTLVGMFVAPTILTALDPLPEIPPAKLSVQPWEAVAAAAVLLVVATFVGGWLAARAARRISLAEVMRVG